MLSSVQKALRNLLVGDGEVVPAFFSRCSRHPSQTLARRTGMITRLLGELGGDLVAEESCLVCLEPVSSSACVRCSAPPHHVLCDSCFLSHVDSVPEPRIRACRGRVPCPGDGWHDSHFGPSEIASVALRYGCRAMRCGVCGFYYCWLCFHKELTNQAIHRHVRDAHGDLFVAQRAVDLAHGAWRRSVVSDFMRGIEDAALRDAVLSLTRSNLAALDASLPRHGW
ncbi:hypothetical protein EMIHUDRAFT_218686 [Emiliania huxleyi CCMP1516]|uniref:Uncharacterized protein n=2 Tax=Emiliania huxleyi TaxID=2903 RepID=A0A0D3I6S8_EMIH1|nr:hypothetical protein EMIHUDRAFT_218686 [Emiliania huxleyi CCMP1516]EOD06963.1 hypothetical protein EMIHUDRAFT_218686 [Emiliania huxleyi CCMP1516]|eukprot:XP_005759392.1 hypothetical protein EMIHUDRAFT_218686 [Emiliania huxleyi CCMP1516]